MIIKLTKYRQEAVLEKKQQKRHGSLSELLQYNNAKYTYTCAILNDLTGVHVHVRLAIVYLTFQFV